MSEENKNRFGRVLGFIFRNPINILALIVILYSSFHIFILKSPDFAYKIALVCAVGIWLFLFVIRHFFKILLLVAIIGACFYGWHVLSSQDKIACEEKGGFWNKNTLTCEEKVPFMEKLEKFFKISMK